MAHHAETDPDTSMSRTIDDPTALDAAANTDTTEPATSHRAPTPSSEADLDVVVIGGGIVGLATAHRLLEHRPGLRVLVLERETEVGRHQSSRNSGVLHAGLYYTPGSSKARWSRAGKPLMERFCAEHGVPFERTGKVVVAVDRAEVPALDALAERARTNGVEVHRLGPSGLRDHEPHVAGVAGLWTPETAVTDFGAVCHALADAIRAADGEVRTDTEVVDLHATREQVDITTSRGSVVTARAVVACGGLQADRLLSATATGTTTAGRTTAGTGTTTAGRTSTATGPTDDVRIVPIRGSWLELRPDQHHLVRGNIYPVPTGGGLPFLGVHLTRRVDGRVWVGPNAVPVFAREGRSPASLDTHDARAVLAYPGSWRLARAHWQVVVGEVWRDRVLAATTRAVQRYVPAIERAHLRRGPWGVRAQLVDRRGRLVDDFTIRELGRTIHLLNAPSPAATSALTIGGELAERALARLGA
jgi:(S)-2-hydroxyglutarate dehydrogenase